MTVRLDANSVRLTPPQKSGLRAAATPGVMLGTPPVPSVSFDTSDLTATGVVKLLGTRGESCAGWALGFFQLQFVEVNQARYRGTTNTDGSMLVRRDRPPSRPQQLCRDTTAPGGFWYYPPGAGSGVNSMMALGAGSTIPANGEQYLAVEFYDSPSENYPHTQANTLFAPARVNFIHSATLGFAFCTLLTLQDPGGNFHFLKHFYWNCRWSVHFRAVGGVISISRTDDADLSLQATVRSGIPTDPRFNRVNLLNLTLPVCNTIAGAATPGNIQRSLTWA